MTSNEIPPDIRGNIILSPIWRAVHSGGNRIVLINGLPRTGKSELAINMAYHLFRGPGPEFKHLFEVGKHCKWSKIDFQKIVQKYDRVGACLVWDEAGISELGAHARQFWSQSNIALSTLFQIMGFHNQIALITLPMKTMLDKHLRLLSHVNVETLKISKASNTCKAKFFWVEMSTRSDAPFTKYPRFIDSEGFRCRAKVVSVPRAPDRIRREYAVYSNVFKKWLEKRLIRGEVTRTVGSDKVTRKTSVEKLREVYEVLAKNPKAYWDSKTKKHDPNKIMFAHDVPQNYCRILAKWLDTYKGKALKPLKKYSFRQFQGPR